MARKNDPQTHVKLLHSIDSFGVKEVSLNSIRIEKLEDRLDPKVPFPHRHDFFQLMLVTQGKGMHQIDFTQHEVKRQKIFFMKPGQMHSWEMNKGVRGLILEFNQQGLSGKAGTELMQECAFIPDAFDVEEDGFHEILSLTEMMMKEFPERSKFHDLVLEAQLILVLTFLTRMAHKKRVIPLKEIALHEKLKGLIEAHYKEFHGVEFYAKKLATTPQALTMRLARSLGKSPRAMIQERILLEAKRYLVFSALSVSEVGHELGFDDANYFTRFFKVHEKKTPAKFRKENSQDH